MAFTNHDLEEFFKQRMVELYDKNTLDSYSVRTCNSLSMFYELKEILEGWIACNVKRGETVANCIQECVSLLEIDDWLDFSFYDKLKLVKQLKEYEKVVARIKDSRNKTDVDNNSASFILHLVVSFITNCLCLSKYNDTVFRTLKQVLKANCR